MRIHLLGNVHREDAVEAARCASEFLFQNKVDVGAEEELAKRIGLEAVSEDGFGRADLVISFGGDGTLIRAAHLCSELGTPVLGVYYGRFGFVTQCQGEELAMCLTDFFEGKVALESRMMIQTDLYRAGQVIATLHSLNEMVLQRAVTVRMMTFDVKVDGHPLTTYPADGVIVCTPTGSTGYNLSAGGPIIDPGVQAMLLTALSPHTLSSRPLILKPESVIEFKVQTEGDAVLSADGQNRLHLLTGDEVRVTKSPRVTRLVRVEKDDFLVKLGERLFWSKSAH